MAGYTRQSTANIQTGQPVTAAPLTAEFNQLQAAFSGTTGHTHDGGVGNGPTISLTTAVSGTLPIANGGTASATAAAARTALFGVSTTVDNTLARYDGVTGSLQTSPVVVSDAGATSGITSLTIGGALSGVTTLTTSGALLLTANDGAALGASGTAWSDLFLASGGVINFNAGDVTVTHSANALNIAGGTLITAEISAGGHVYPSSDNTYTLGVVGSNTWADIALGSGATIDWNGTNTLTQTSTTGNPEITNNSLWINEGNLFVGAWAANTPGTGNNSTGIGLNTNGSVYASRNGSAAAHLNRTSDGQVIGINSAGVNQGGIGVSAGTVSVTAFMGAHWAQMADGQRMNIPRGTIVDSISQMSQWPEPKGPGEYDRLPCFKISDTVGSKAVYGVFHIWDDDYTETNDAEIASLGAYFVRMHRSAVVEIGDYVESNGDGTGKLQAQPYLMNKTVAKITSTEVQHTYPDGSYLLPCTLHCG